MKVLLMSLNSKFIHSNLAIQYIERYFKIQDNPKLREVVLVKKEFTINNEMDIILRELSKGNYDYIFVSAYIWNIEPLSLLFTNFRKINQHCKIIFGGPEVMYNPLDQMNAFLFLDGVVIGEGELVFYELINNFVKYDVFDEAVKTVKGFAYRNGGELLLNSPRPLINPLDQIPFPYTDLSEFNNRILYYESSRGCPYNCSYCLSSALKGLRYFSLERVYKDLSVFLSANVPQVKFVDRTFNAKKEHAISILNYLIENDNGITNFHFEITAHLLDEDYFNVIKRARTGLFQFEIGVQTTHELTMQAINRPMIFEELRQKCLKLLSLENCHIHLDLIAGLPHENFKRFMQSFDDVFEIKPHQLQVGFLKLLKGTALYNQKSIYGYEIRTEAPYEILFNNDINFEELSVVKDIEALVEYYYNSEKFIHTLNYMLANSSERPHEMFLKLRRYFVEHDYFSMPISTYRLYEILLNFAVDSGFNINIASDLLKLDYYRSNLKGQREIFDYTEIANFNNRRLHLLRDDNFVATHLPQYVGLTPKQILKNVEFITLKYDIIALIQSGYKEVIQTVTVILIDYQAKETSEKMLKVVLPETV